jgi:hypothetical protein
VADGLGHPVLFGTTQATWAPIDLRFELLYGEADLDRLAAARRAVDSSPQ